MSIPFPGLCTDHQRQQRTETGNVCGNEDPLNEKTMTIDPEFAIARELAPWLQGRQKSGNALHRQEKTLSMP